MIILSLFLLILCFALLIFHKFKKKKEMFTIPDKKRENKIVMCRIIGNALPDINHQDQNLNNLEYILKNEDDFPNVKKVWVLNRIIDKNMEEKYIKLLKTHKKDYEVLPFNLEYFNTIPIKLSSNPVKDVKENMKRILYTSNINGARNYALDRFKKNVDYVMVLDSNIYLSKDGFTEIERSISKNEYDYILVPIKRISNYSDVNDNNILNSIKNEEPQIIFSRNSTLNFNEDIPYGFSNKVELLNLIGSKGMWNSWKDNERIGVVSRKSNGKIYRHNTCSHFIRLPSKFDGKKHKKITQEERTNAILKLINI